MLISARLADPFGGLLIILVRTNLQYAILIILVEMHCLAGVLWELMVPWIYYVFFFRGALSSVKENGRILSGEGGIAKDELRFSESAGL